MKILMVAGGSGGHIYPCLELAKYFKLQGEEVILGGSLNSIEEKIYRKEGFKYIGLDINKSKITSYFKNVRKVKRIYKDLKIDALILFGNYISLNFGVAAILSKIPIFLHEQNIIYGRANKLLGIFAHKIYLSLPIKRNFYKKKSQVLGNPKGEAIVDKVALDKSYYHVVIVMGSLGSYSINNILKSMIDKIEDNRIMYHIVVGKKYYESFSKNGVMRSNINIYQ